jgi:curved DNA-binding protein CbpA
MTSMRQFSDTNYYEVLGVPSKATHDQIRAAYRELARTTHPDAGGDPAQFGLIAEAWEVLGNQAEREHYDADRSLRMRAARPYVRLNMEQKPTGAAAADDGPDDDGLSERQRWMQNKRRF